MNWTDDKHFSDRYLPAIKRILGEHLIGEPREEEDRLRNTDLIVLKMEAVRIACRIRRDSYLEAKAFAATSEFTIRAGRPNGIKTELAKIIEGWGNYFFYGFGEETSDRLVRWTLADLNVFRLWYMQHLLEHQGKPPTKMLPNSDGSSSFCVFQWNALPAAFVKARD